MGEALIEVKNLKKYFPTPYGLLHAVDDVSFTIEKGSTLGVVGESGCGKSTLGRLIISLLDKTSGEVYYRGEEISHLSRKKRNELRKKLQIIFQDPYSSLDPRKSVRNIIAEPLKIFKICKKADELDARVAELMEIVGLDARFAGAFPHEMDGGRRQRVGIARALALNPEFIVCDEPVSALDVSIQAQILNLLEDLQEQQGLTYMFITHNLIVVRHIADEIMVMYLGCVVEKCDTETLFENPLHPYTKGLLAAIPEPDIHAPKSRVLLTGELASPIDPKPGCRFAVRCPYADDLCRTKTPEIKEEEPGHWVACHHCLRLKGQARAQAGA
ncbi:MAG: ABC transporter ATP-binding protein [Oscillospiraceae bacterium]